MSDMHGAFIWYELMTTDTAGAGDFYQKVVGWTPKDSGMPGMAYTLFDMPGAPVGVGGMMAMPPELRAQEVPPNWMGYVAVDNVDAMSVMFHDEGGTVHSQPSDIPGVGRFAVVADPQGAFISLLQPSRAEGAPEGSTPPFADATSPGHFGWSELMAVNVEKAFDFYRRVFGWTKDQAIDIGPLGLYQLFAHKGRVIGGMMTKMPDQPAPFWGYYVNVEAIDTAAGRVTAEGGRILMGPVEVPGGGWVVNCLDAQGAYFALLAPTR